MAVTVFLLGLGAVSTTASATEPHPLLPPHHPGGNFRLASLTHVLASIDAARASEEGLGPLRFDAARFARLDVAEQVFVLSNLERTSRGLPAAVALTRRLDLVAQTAASRDADPTDRGHSYWSIWSSAPASLGQTSFFTDFGWMYDDGPPPQYIFRNVDCSHAGQAGCWGHRDNILVRPAHRSGTCRSELVAGTAYAPRSSDGPSVTEIFETSCLGVHRATVLTWRHAVSLLKIPPAEA